MTPTYKTFVLRGDVAHPVKDRRLGEEFHGRHQEVKWKGETLIYLQARNEGDHPIGLVVGYRMKEIAPDDFGYPSVVVRLVPAEDEEEIRTLLRGELLGPIMFWK